MARKRTKFHQGIFKPLNPQKYKGDPTNVIFRSRWELKCMSDFDKHPDIIEWSSEEVVVQYKNPITGRVHRYFPDFVIKKRNHSDNRITTIMIEVKPHKETKPPRVQSGKKPSKKYLTEVATWGKNSAKWEAADKYCKQRGWEFIILTEKEIFGD